MQVKPSTKRPLPALRVPALSRILWPKSIAVNFGIAAAAGFLYILFVLGPQRLIPNDLSWLGGDAVSPVLAWGFFHNDPHLHWPLTFTKDINYPIGDSVAFMDPNPLLLLVLRLFSLVMPVPLQFLGWAAVIACALQFFFSARLFMILSARTLLSVLLPSLFFLTAPVMTWRLAEGHYALMNQWTIVAALCILVGVIRAEALNAKNFALWCIVLGAVVVGVNVYLALMVIAVLTAAIVTAWMARYLSFRKALLVLALTAAACLISASAFGLLRAGGGYGSGGYRMYSMNLLAPFDPGSSSYGSILFRIFPKFVENQYEGYNYLGAGLILLLIMLLPYVPKLWRVWRPCRLVFVPLTVCCLSLTMLALSTQITFGSKAILDLDPHQELTNYLSLFRASGRLFWPVYYTLLATILAACFTVWKPTKASLLVVAALALQMADTAPLRRWTKANVSVFYSDPLRSPVWSSLGKTHKNLLILPAFQCGRDNSPGGDAGYRIFGLLAVSQKMRTNSYYASRYRPADLQYQCGAAVTNLYTKPLDPDSVYVVTPALARLIAKGPTGPGKCHTLDQFILCSSKTDFGLSPLIDPGELLQNPLANPGFEDRDLSAWPIYKNVAAGISAAHAHGGNRSLAETSGVGSAYQDVFGLDPGRRYTVTAWMSGTPGTTATAQIAVYDPGANVAVSSSALIPSQSWQMVTDSITVHAPGTLRIHLFRNDGTGTIFWDDVHIYQEH